MNRDRTEILVHDSFLSVLTALAPSTKKFSQSLNISEEDLGLILKKENQVNLSCLSLLLNKIEVDYEDFITYATLVK